jgi:hypothetical protein
LDEALVAGGSQSFDILVLDEALERLGALDPNRPVLWSSDSSRSDGGRDSRSDVDFAGNRHWAIARAWLARELEGNSTA